MRCVCFDLLNTMLKTASELGITTWRQDVAPNAIYGKSLDELERGLLSLAARICEQVEQTTGRKSSR